MRKIPLVLIIAFFVQAAAAQTAFNIDVGGSGTTNGYGIVRVNNPSALGQKMADDVNYEDITGTPYFNTRWNAAIIILAGNMAVKVDKAKLNFYTGNLHYVDSAGKELIADPSVVKKIFFLDSRDTLKTIAVFQQISGLQDKQPTAFIQVLNSGKVELLKLTRIVLGSRGYNTLKGKDEYSFQHKESYYVVNDGVVNVLKALNKDAVTAVVPPNTAAENWLDTNKNKLKTEADIISFFAYFNANN